MCDRIGIMHHGEMIALEPTHELVRKLSNRRLKLWLEQSLTSIPAELEHFAPSLENGGSILQLNLPAGESAGLLLAQICQSGLKIRDLETDQSGLEEVFIQLTGMGGGNNGPAA
jgi:ABC-2 type transport system ATP-binding protein